MNTFKKVGSVAPSNELKLKLGPVELISAHFELLFQDGKRHAEDGAFVLVDFTLGEEAALATYNWVDKENLHSDHKLVHEKAKGFFNGTTKLIVFLVDDGKVTRAFAGRKPNAFVEV